MYICMYILIYNVLHLFKAVVLKIFKAKNVQNSNPEWVLSPGQCTQKVQTCTKTQSLHLRDILCL